MEINKLSLDLIVVDVLATVDFYTKVLGFEKIEADSHFARLKAGNSEVMLMLKSDFDSEIPSLNRSTNSGWFVLIVEVQNINEVYENIQSKVKIVRNLETTSYGTQEFILTDPDGHLVQFTQRN